MRALFCSVICTIPFISIIHRRKLREAAEALRPGNAQASECLKLADRQTDPDSRQNRAEA